MEAPVRLDVSARFRCSRQSFDRAAILQLLVGAHTEKLPDGAAVGVTQLYFDETFQKQNQGIDTGSMESMNMGPVMGLGARCKPGSIKLFCLLPKYHL